MWQSSKFRAETSGCNPRGRSARGTLNAATFAADNRTTGRQCRENVLDATLPYRLVQPQDKQ
jgi:hypothetical protein